MITFDEAENHTLRCKKFGGRRVKDVDLLELDNFLGWGEDIQNPVSSLEEDLAHIRRYLTEEHIAARLQAEMEE